MISQHLKIAFRNLRNHKAVSAINMIGLSIGLAACLLILEFVCYELSFDRFNTNAEDIYRITNDRYQEGKRIQHGTITYSAVGPAMKADFPEVLENTRVEPMGAPILTVGTDKFQSRNSFAVDNSFLSIFTYPLVAGDPTRALVEPFSIVLSESLARKIFPVKNDNFNSLVGRSLQIGTDSMPYKITGVCKEVPENSHLEFDLLYSYSTLYSGPNPYNSAKYDFTDSDFWHYLKLKHGTDYKALENKLAAFSQRHFMGNEISGNDEVFFLQPLTRVHLYSDYEYEIGKTGSSTAVWGMLIIAVLIIIIAWVNYVNLTTARSLSRAKEVGIRKVSGATRTQLIRQFLTESLLMNLFALTLALLLIVLLQSTFNKLVDRQLSLSYIFSPAAHQVDLKWIILGGLLAGILASGYYPAFVLSSFKPSRVLKGKFSQSGKGILLRKSLVIVQFAATVTLIIGSWIVYKQIAFVNNQDLGIDMAQVVIAKPPMLSNFDSSFISHQYAFRQALRGIPGVMNAASSNRVAGEELSRSFNTHRTDEHADLKLTIRTMGVDDSFFKLYGIPLVAGRNFNFSDYNYDYHKLNKIVLTEAAVKAFDFSSNEAALGKDISVYGSNWEIVGVVKDFHQKSLHYPKEPILFFPTMGTNNPISIKMNARDIHATIEKVKSTFHSFFPGNLFNFYFLDAQFKALYQGDQLFGKVFALFAGFAIFIACLGLLGLSLYTTAQRTKEIGMRKVLGASVPNIVLLLSKDLVGLIAVSFLLAAPLAWFVMHQWLQGFAYRTPIRWWIFPGAGLLAFILAIGTVSLQTLKVALSNPVNSLRSE